MIDQVYLNKLLLNIASADLENYELIMNDELDFDINPNIFLNDKSISRPFSSLNEIFNKQRVKMM